MRVMLLLSLILIFITFLCPQGLPRASEVISDIKIELSDLNYLCYHVYLASKGLHELNPTYTYQRGDLSSIDLRGYAAGKNWVYCSFDNAVLNCQPTCSPVTSSPVRSILAATRFCYSFPGSTDQILEEKCSNDLPLLLGSSRFVRIFWCACDSCEATDTYVERTLDPGL